MGDRDSVIKILKDLGLRDSFVKRLEEAVFEDTKNEEEWVYKDILYEKIGQIKENPEKADQIINDGDYTWGSCIFEPYRNDEEFNLEELVNGIKVEKGEFKCRNKKCRSNGCYFFTSQTRSGDEGATVYVICTKCNTRYKFN